jgi:inhibitor of KinA sporulation pathway (predicted exonuclease)
MKNLTYYVCLTAVSGCLMFSGPELSAQSKKQMKNLEKTVETNAEKIERATEDLEKLAEHLEAQTDQLSEHMERWMEDHGSELESWAKRHAAEWEKWAESFEHRMERWASEQEHHWEKWADEYSSKWEQWAEQLESGELEPAEMNQLMKRNMEMLSKMPWEKLVRDAMVESSKGLKDAPWEGLEEIHELIGKSVELQLERLEKSGDKSKDLTTEYDHLRNVLEKLQAGLEQKQSELQTASKKKIAALKQELEKSDMSNARKKQLIAALERQYQDVMAIELAAAKNKIKQTYELKKQGQEKSDKVQALVAAKQAAAMAKREAELHAHRAELERTRALEVARAVKLHKQAIEEAKSAVERNRKGADLFRNLEKKDRESKAKESEIDALRQEIESLRAEIERLKKAEKGKY